MGWGWEESGGNFTYAENFIISNSKRELSARRAWSSKICVISRVKRVQFAENIQPRRNFVEMDHFERIICAQLPAREVAARATLAKYKTSRMYEYKINTHTQIYEFNYDEF